MSLISTTLVHRTLRRSWSGWGLDLVSHHENREATAPFSVSTCPACLPVSNKKNQEMRSVSGLPSPKAAPPHLELMAGSQVSF